MLFNNLNRDIERLINRKATAYQLLKLMLLDVSVQSVALFRTQTFLSNHKMVFWAKLVRNLNHYLTGAEFGIGAKIGPGLIIRHPNGIVIGHGVVIGEDCTLLHQVTLGERYGEPQPENRGIKYPIVGNKVTIGAGAKILGPITIGDNSKIGANAVVLKDVGCNCVAVGVPAKVIGEKTNEEYALQVSQ